MSKCTSIKFFYDSREPRLLVDPHYSSAAVKKDVALVVGHELAHQWFGNLVSIILGCGNTQSSCDCHVTIR